jgi:hypothetical protein
MFFGNDGTYLSHRDTFRKKLISVYLFPLSLKEQSVRQTYEKDCMLIRVCFCPASVNGKCCGSVLWGQPAYLRRDHLLLDTSRMSTAARQKENFLAGCNEQASTIQSANFTTAYPSPSRCTVQEALVAAQIGQEIPTTSQCFRTTSSQINPIHIFISFFFKNPFF